MSEQEKVRDIAVSEPSAGQKPELPPKPRLAAGWKFLIVLVALALCALIAYRIVQSRQPELVTEETPAYVSITAAQIGEISVSTTITGQVQSEDSAMVFAAASAEVSRIYVEVGDYVNRGQTLFTMDSTQVRGSVSQSQVAVDTARAALEVAERNLERMQALYESNAISLATLEQAEDAVISAQNGVRQAQASLSSASDAMSLYSYTAPISGYVTEVNIQEGMYPLSTSAAVVINNLDRLEITANVSEYLVGYLQEGMPARFRISALGDELYVGTLDSVAMAPASTGLTYPITVSIDEPNPDIKPGMFAELLIISNHKEDALIIPSAAVMIRNGQSIVAVLNGDLPSIREVETGLDNGETVEILSGLSAGETVITQGQYFVTEGQPVVVVTD